MQSRILLYISTTTASTLFITPIMDYGDNVWSKGPQSNLNRLQQLQKKAGKVILRCRRRTHVSNIHSSLGWLTPQNNIKLHKTLMIGKCLLGVVPSYLRGKFIRAKDLHTYSTRNANSNLFVPRVSNHAAKICSAMEGCAVQYSKYLYQNQPNLQRVQT